MPRDRDDQPTSVFDLTVSELRPIVEAAAGVPVGGFDIAIEHEVAGPYGFAAEKLIPTFRYTSAAGPGEVTIFVKRQHNPAAVESAHYHHLTAAGAPVPKLYGACRDGEGREVLFLEYLDAGNAATWIGSPEEYRAFNALTARFNATRLSDAYRDWLLTRRDLPAEIARAEDVLVRAWEHAHQGRLGEALQSQCAHSPVPLSRLQRLIREVAAETAAMPVGLLHTDFSRENTARRFRTGERLVLDLELLCLGPRFFDVGMRLGRPDDEWPPPYDGRELAQHYLEEYARWGGAPVPPLDDFRGELRTLWLAGSLVYLDWMLSRCLFDWADSPEDQREQRGCQEELQSSLLRLIDACQERD